MERVDTVIIGAGVVGLAVACELSNAGKEALVVERNSGFGQETSSRNSEVIHSGIYYPTGSLKHMTCVEGRDLLYEYCRKYSIANKKAGKLIVAVDKDEVKALEALYANGINNGVANLIMLSRLDIKKMEPQVDAEAALYSPSTGILDTHSFMKSLAGRITAAGGQIAYRSELIGIAKSGQGFEITVKDNTGEELRIRACHIVNSAGLYADKVALMAGLNRPDYRIKYCKGDYFRVRASKAKHIAHLVYPVPKPSHGGLGIHVTLDLAGGMRLGPDDEYVDKIFYEVDPAKAGLFFESARKFLPFLGPGDINVDTSGVRPKLQGPGEDFRDYIIQDEARNGLPGLINLIGIESPGFTASLAIARRVKDMVLQAA